MVEVPTEDVLLPGGTAANQITDDPEAYRLAQLCLALVKISVIHSWFAFSKSVLGAHRNSAVSHFPAARRDTSEELF